MTADASKLRELADRCEREGPSLVLDFWIHVALNPGKDSYEAIQADIDKVGIEGMDNPVRYSTSRDGAATLMLDGCWKEITGPRKYLNIPTFSPNYWRCNLTNWDLPGSERNFDGWGVTEAAATCAAALRARASLAEPHVEATP